MKQNDAITTDTRRSSKIEVQYTPNETLACTMKLYSTTFDGVERMEDERAGMTPLP